MNRIAIINSEGQVFDENTYVLTYQSANKMLAILRSDHFKEILLTNTQQIRLKDLKFLIQLTRLLKNDGFVTLKGGSNQQLSQILKKLHLFEGTQGVDSQQFHKTKPVVVQEKKEKLAIGFSALRDEETIDESELLEGENLNLSKKQPQNCDTKPRACANCSCGRKDNEKSYSKEQLVKSINDGQTVSGCGKCSLGDSFRCGTCPYKGLPAFKPGDKLKLDEEGGVLVEAAATYVSNSGKVKLDL